MKIARVEALHCDGGWRPWTFVRIETDDGLVGWGECSDNRSPYGIAGCVRDLADAADRPGPAPGRAPVLGHAARARGRTWAASRTRRWPASSWRSGTSRPRRSGCRSTSCSAGPLRDRMRLYWSHCGTTRARIGHDAGHAAAARPTTTSPRSGKEVVARGFTALKTNIVIPGDPATVYFPGFAQRHQHHRRRAHGGDPRRRSSA